MSTQIKSKNGDILWQANDFGEYDMEKIRLITSIIKSLLDDLNIKMDTSGSLADADVYSKSEIDSKFSNIDLIYAKLADIDSRISNSVAAYLGSGNSPVVQKSTYEGFVGGEFTRLQTAVRQDEDVISNHSGRIDSIESELLKMLYDSRVDNHNNDSSSFNQNNSYIGMTVLTRLRNLESNLDGASITGLQTRVGSLESWKTDTYDVWKGNIDAYITTSSSAIGGKVDSSRLNSMGTVVNSYLNFNGANENLESILNTVLDKLADLDNRVVGLGG